MTTYSASHPPNAKDIANILTDFVNNYGCNTEEFVSNMLTQHRTLQQSVFRLMLNMIDAWSREKLYDLRNEQTILMCRDIKELIEKKYNNMYVSLI